MSHPISHLGNPVTRTLDTFATYLFLGLVIVLPITFVVAAGLNTMLTSGYKFLGSQPVRGIYCSPSCEAGLAIKWIFSNWYIPLAMLMGLYGILRGIIDSISTGLFNTLLVILLRVAGFSAIYHIYSWAPTLNEMLYPLYSLLKAFFDLSWDALIAVRDWTLFTFFGKEGNLREGLAIPVQLVLAALGSLLKWALIALVSMVALLFLIALALRRRRPSRG